MCSLGMIPMAGVTCTLISVELKCNVSAFSTKDGEFVESSRIANI